MGDEERRDGDGGDVDEHLRPRRPEADELVEAVAGEARGAAGLRVANGPLRVGRRGRGEAPATTKTSGVSPRRERRGDAERVVDRGADVAVGRREERRRAEHSLEAMRATASRREGYSARASRSPGRCPLRSALGEAGLRERGRRAHRLGGPETTLPVGVLLLAGRARRRTYVLVTSRCPQYPRDRSPSACCRPQRPQFR